MEPPSKARTELGRTTAILAALLVWGLLAHPRLGGGAVGGGGSGNTTTTTSTTRHETHTRVDLPNADAYATRVLGLLTQAAPAGEAFVFDQTSPHAPSSAEVAALDAAAFSALETAANDTGVLAGSCAALLIANPALAASNDVVGPAIKVDEELNHIETSVTTTTTFGPATILVGEDQSQTFFVAAGTTNVNTNTHTESFIDDFFLATVTHESTYEVVGTKTVGPAGTPCVAPIEDCGNCIDDDGDAIVDRDDFGCPARADGGGAALGAPKPEGKAIGKCGAALQKGGAKIFAARLKHLQKCSGAVLACLQLKATDPACLAKATGTCAKELGARAKDEAKLAATIRKACAVGAFDAAALLSDPGLGLAREGTTCAALGVATLATIDDVASCVARHHACRAEQVLAFETPRAAELLTAAGRDPAVDAPCLPPAGTPGGALTDPARAKLAVKCAKTIGKAGQMAATSGQKLAQKCGAALLTCVQQKPGDSGCLEKARSLCVKATAKIGAAGGKLSPALAKACGTLTASELGDANGLGFGVLADTCGALDTGAPSDAAGVAACLNAQHACRVAQLLELEQPRLKELLDLGQVPTE